MDYNKEILTDKEYYCLLKETIEEIGNAVTSTLGPDGRTVIIKNYNGQYYVTKDGVSVLKSIGYRDPQKNIITDIIKEVAQKTVDEAGDGTTTSILFTQFFILKGIELLEKGTPYKDIREELSFLEKEITEEINKSSVLITEDKKGYIKKITNVASNGDSSIVDLVLEAFKYSDHIKITEDINLKDNIEKENGYIIERKNKSINTYVEDGTYKDLNIVLLNDKLTSFSKTLSKKINKTKANLIVAHSFNNHVVEKVGLYNKQYQEKIILIEAPGMSDFKRLLIDDIVSYCNLDKDDDFYVGGDKVSVKIDFNKVTIFSETNPQLENKIKFLEKAIRQTNDEVSKNTLETRLEKLTDKTVTIRVGGESNIEAKERRDRVEDAVLAVNCALNEGILPGGGEFLKSLHSKYSQSLFSDLFLIPSKKLEENGTDLSTLDTSIIIDPSKVTKTAFKNAISVSKTLLSTATLITSPYEL
jgi:chaperonin GroEL